MYRRHECIRKILSVVNGTILNKFDIRFTGGTAIALNHVEYRQSDDMDFMVCGKGRFFEFVNILKLNGLDTIFTNKCISTQKQCRVKWERDALRLFVFGAEESIKMEFFVEDRLEPGPSVPGIFGIMTNSPKDLVVSKFLALFDRFPSRASKRRDLYDLLALSTLVDERTFDLAMSAAEAIYYGVPEVFRRSVSDLIADMFYERRLSVSDSEMGRSDFSEDCEALKIEDNNIRMLQIATGRLFNRLGLDIRNILVDCETETPMFKKNTNVQHANRIIF